jgi:hypothetical protein
MPVNNGFIWNALSDILQDFTLTLSTDPSLTAHDISAFELPTYPLPLPTKTCVGRPTFASGKYF